MEKTVVEIRGSTDVDCYVALDMLSAGSWFHFRGGLWIRGETTCVNLSSGEEHLLPWGGVKHKDVCTKVAITAIY